MNYLISVIVPIYNAEENLQKTIESIINQSIGFKNIELLLIDDNSADNSKSIITDYANKYDNIVPIFLEKNSGWASVPRNEGMKHASADYIMFIDSDDEYDENICEKFYKTVQAENADVVSCNYISRDNISQSKVKFDIKGNDEDTLITGDKVLEFDNIFVWNKIFKRDIIIDNGLTFKEMMSEDFIFCMEYLLKSSKRIHLNDYYGYVKNNQNESLSNNSSLEAIISRIEVDKLVADLVKRDIKNPAQLKKLHNNIFKSSLTYRVEEIITLNDADYKEALRQLYLFEKKINFELNLNNTLINFINKLILKKRCALVIIIFKIFKALFNSRISRQIYRKISN